MGGPWEEYQDVGAAPAAAANAEAGPWTQYQQPADFSDVTATSSTTAKPPKQRTTAQKLAREVGGLGLRNVVEGAADLAGIVTDPVLDVINWAGEKGPTTNSLITGKPERRWPEQQSTRASWSGLLDLLGVPKPENDRERVAGDIGRALTGTALTMGAGGLLNAGRASITTPTIGGRIGDLLTAQPGWQLASAVGGAGASGATREAGGDEGAQALAGLLGGFAPQATGALGAGSLRTLARGRNGEQMQKTIRDFATMGATPSVGQATGSRAIQGVESLLAGGPTSSGVMARFAERQAERIGDGLQATANKLSPRSSAEQAGRAIKHGVLGEGGFKETARNLQSRLYDDLDKQIDPSTRVEVSGAEQALKNLNPAIPGAPNLSPLFQNARIHGIERALKRDAWGPEAVASRPGMADQIQQTADMLKSRGAAVDQLNSAAAAAIERQNVMRTSLGQKPIEFVPYPTIGKADVDQEISKLLAEKADGKLPYEALKKLRTVVGQEIEDAGLMSDVPRSKWRALYSALSNDMRMAAEAKGPEAVRAWSRANKYTNFLMKRMDAIQHVIDKNGGPERVFESAMSGTRDGGTTLRAVMQSLPLDAQKTVTAATIKRMGLATPNGQNTSGDVFSAGTFMTNWNRLSPEAKRSLFDRYGSDFSKNMDRIARVADNIKRGSKVYANPSGSGDRVAAYSYGVALVGSLLSGRLPTAGLLAAGGVGANASARILTSPRAVAWLARSTDLPKAAALASIRQLATGSDDPGVLALQQAINSYEGVEQP
ncbi:hypothetical protein [Lysobacter sp. 22409]|uniref:hypothetical protein n=1 Tax=Lysobacter sp. 22409 TaxID=3453917 RepID=UPI003F8381E1